MAIGKAYLAEGGKVDFNITLLALSSLTMIEVCLEEKGRVRNANKSHVNSCEVLQFG